MNMFVGAATLTATASSVMASNPDAATMPHKSKLLTGYKNTDGVNSGSSTNYAVNTTSGNVAPTTTDIFTTQVTPTLSSNGLGYASFGTRQKIAAAAFLSGSNGTKIRLTLTGATTGGTVLTDVFVGHAGTAPNFDGNQVRVTFGGSNGVTLSNTTVVSDAVTFAFDHTKDLIVAFGFASGTQSARLNTSAGSNFTEYEKASAAADTGSTSVTGYTTNANEGILVANVEIVTSTTINNMTLVTTPQTADATVSNVRVLMEFDNTATPTLNTDLTVEVTCNGGANWTSASLSAVSTNGQGGRKIAETVDQATTAGTSFAARIKTLNNKNITIYGVSVTAH
jgi:hypothetical protein